MVYQAPFLWAQKPNQLQASQISEFQERLMNLPDVVPLSDKAKKIIKEPITIDREEAIEKEGLEASFSSDCKNWKKNLSEGIFKKQVVFLKSKDGYISAVDESSRVMVLDGRPDVLQVNDDAIWGLSDSKFFYRPLKRGKVSQGLLGIINSIALLAVEFAAGDQWSIIKTKENKLLLILSLGSKSEYQEIKKYFALRCQKQGCQLIPRVGGKLVDLTSDKKALALLKKREFFSVAQQNLLTEACDRLTRIEFKSPVEKVLLELRKKCNLDLKQRLLTSGDIAALCSELTSDIIPMFRNF